MFFSRPAGHKYISAPSSEPNEFNFTLEDFTTNGLWNDLDLSSIIGSKEALVILAISIQTTEYPCEFLLDTKNTLVKYNNVGFRPFTINEYYSYFLTVLTDVFGKIKYLASDVTWSDINISVIGCFAK